MPAAVALGVPAVHRQERQVDRVGRQVAGQAGVGDAVARVVEDGAAELEDVAEEEVLAGGVDGELLVGGGERVDPHARHLAGGAKALAGTSRSAGTPRARATSAAAAGTTKRQPGFRPGDRTDGAGVEVVAVAVGAEHQVHVEERLRVDAAAGIMRTWGKRLPRYFSARVSER